MQERLDELISSSVFRALSARGRESIRSLGTIERIHRGYRIAEQGQPMRLLVLLERGRVRLERAVGPRALPIAYRGPSDLVGETGVLDGVAAESAVAVEESSALMLPMQSFRRLVWAEAEIRLAVLEALLALRVEAEDRLARLLRLDVEARLRGFLLTAAERWGRRHPDGLEVAAAFTHAEIAAVIGVTRETVTLLFGKLRREGFVASQGRAIVLTPSALVPLRSAQRPDVGQRGAAEDP